MNQLIMQAAQQYRAEDRQRFVDYVRNEPMAAAQLRAPLFEDKVVDFLFAKAEISERDGDPRRRSRRRSSPRTAMSMARVAATITATAKPKGKKAAAKKAEPQGREALQKAGEGRGRCQGEGQAGRRPSRKARAGGEGRAGARRPRKPPMQAR